MFKENNRCNVHFGVYKKKTKPVKNLLKLFLLVISHPRI